MHQAKRRRLSDATHPHATTHHTQVPNCSIATSLAANTHTLSHTLTHSHTPLPLTLSPCLHAYPYAYSRPYPYPYHVPCLYSSPYHVCRGWGSARGRGRGSILSIPCSLGSTSLQHDGEGGVALEEKKFLVLGSAETCLIFEMDFFLHTPF